MYVYVSIVYMLCSPMLEEIKNISIYLPSLPEWWSAYVDVHVLYWIVEMLKCWNSQIVHPTAIPKNQY